MIVEVRQNHRWSFKKLPLLPFSEKVPSLPYCFVVLLDPHMLYDAGRDDQELKFTLIGILEVFDEIYSSRALYVISIISGTEVFEFYAKHLIFPCSSIFFQISFQFFQKKKKI